jgi:hypothetical protein
MSGLSSDDILRMAREASFTENSGFDGCFVCNPHSLEHFAALVAAAEREACAKLCDALKNPIDDPLAPVGQYESGGYITAEFLADAIRARGQQENG